METTKTPKQQVRELLDELPDDVSYKEIKYRIYALGKITKGLQDPSPGVSAEEAIAEIKEWREKGRPKVW